MQGFAGDLDVDKELERMEGRGRKRDAPSGNRFEAREQSKKRQQRDSKFGECGGQVVLLQPIVIRV